ncbi:hypothetical protein E4U48_000304 [Claviceps purpurea]|nr:hypothetical protein E4U48_000304 [Claviceps purpurea]KAG6314993.1 hypothetical protein E4U44_001555 [Claviceps purpurea]
MSNMSKVSFPLDKIRPLNSPAGWVAWQEDITAALRMAGFGKLLKGKRGANFVAGDHLGETEALKAKEDWQDKQDAACGMILHVCGPAARQLLKGTTDDPIEEKVTTYFNELEKRYRPTGSAVLQQLRRRCARIKLDNCKDVADYADQLQKARADLKALDEDAVMADMFFVDDFLCGLGPAYDHFITSFNTAYSLL